MEPRKRNVTQTAIHVPQGEGESLWTVGQLLTFKIHSDQSETVGIFDIEVPRALGRRVLRSGSHVGIPCARRN